VIFLLYPSNKENNMEYAGSAEFLERLLLCRTSSLYKKREERNKTSTTHPPS